MMLTEEEYIQLKLQIERDLLKRLREPQPRTYKQMADKAFREKFRELFLPHGTYTPKLANFEQKIRGLVHDIRKRKHPEHIYASPPPIETVEDYLEAVSIGDDLLSFLADHFELRACK